MAPLKPEAFKLLHRAKAVLDRWGAGGWPPVRAAARLLRRAFPGYYNAEPETVPTAVAGSRLVMPRAYFDLYVLDYEPLTRRLFEERLKTGAVAADVGAHIGYYTMLAARLVGPRGRVHAVEPFEESLSFLRRNVELNGLLNVSVHAAAAGARREKRAFHVMEQTNQQSFYGHPSFKTVRTIEVETVPLDELIPGRVDFVKIDVEGAELQVLDGMRRLLAESPAAELCVEWNADRLRLAGEDPLALPRRLRELGFSALAALDDRKGRPEPVESLEERVRAGRIPRNWFVNVWARRRA